MRQTKYITSGGLAFAEDKDMEKLRSYSLSGWHVRNFQFMGYMLEKGERAEYIYSVDYRLLKDNEEEEYFDFFSICWLVAYYIRRRYSFIPSSSWYKTDLY